MSTKIATANIQKGLGWGPLQKAAARLVKRNVDIIGFQEIYDHRLKYLRKMMARKGYGVAVVQGVPIAYDLKKYKLVDSNARRLPGKAIPGNSLRYGNWVALRDRSTGQVTVMTNTHLSRKRTAREERWHDQQLKELADLQRDLRKRFGNDAQYFMTGDFNNGKLGSKHFNLRGNRYRGHPIDYIFSSERLRQEALMRTASDHDTYIATFRDRKRLESELTKGGGGNVAGGNNDGWGDWNDWYDNYDPPSTVGNPNGLSAFELFTDLLESWGVPVGSDIEEIIRKAMEEGYTPDMIDLLIPDIQNTNSWKSRFPGWHDRVKNGYNQLSVQEYLDLENTYHRIMQEAGLPVGFYDDPSDFGNWIANNVSPDEIQGRVRIATQAAQQIDPTARNLMSRFYGLTTGDIASYFLDQDRALPVIERQYEAANVASWAARAGFGVEDIRRYEDLVDSGITAEQASQSYGTIAAMTNTFGQIAGTYGDSYDQGDAEGDVFFGRDEKRRKLVAKEAATFSGRSQGMTGSAKRNTY